MVVSCRLLGKSDSAALQNAADVVFDEKVDPALAAEFLQDDRHHMAAAFVGDQLVGFASAVHYVHPDKPAQMFINEVGVSPAHQQSGIATRLLNLLLEEARRLGCSEAWVLTDPDNDPANALYRIAGGLAADRHQIMYTFELSGSAIRSA